MGDRYDISKNNKKIFYVDATVLYGHSMSQMLPYGEIELRPGHPDLYMNNLEEISNTLHDNNIGCFVEVDVKCPDIIEEKTNNFHFVLKLNYVIKMILGII